jgi:hypothetical protein
MAFCFRKATSNQNILTTEDTEITEESSLSKIERQDRATQTCNQNILATEDTEITELFMYFLGFSGNSPFLVALLRTLDRERRAALFS